MNTNKAVKRQELFIFRNGFRNNNWAAFILQVKAGIAIIRLAADNSINKYIPYLMLVG